MDTSGWHGNGNEWYDNGPGWGLIRYSNNVFDNEIVPGDILCFNGGTYGHVAVVRCIDYDNDVVKAIAQNVSSTTAYKDYPFDSNGHICCSCQGWLHRHSSVAPTITVSPTGTGWYTSAQTITWSVHDTNPGLWDTYMTVNDNWDPIAWDPDEGWCGPQDESGSRAMPEGTNTFYWYAEDWDYNYRETTHVYKLDLHNPTGSIKINNGAAYTNTTAVTLNLTASDYSPGSGMSGGQMRFSNDNATWSAWQTYATSNSWMLTSGNGTRTVYVQYKDVAGRQSSTYSGGILLDTAPPAGSVIINGGAAYTNGSGVTLALLASDPSPASGVAQMRFSNDNTTWSTWESYGTSKSWALTAGDGSKTVYVQYKDLAGNISVPYTDTIALDTAPPSVTINQASGQADPTILPVVNFSVVFSEPVSDFTGAGVLLSGTAGAFRSEVAGARTTYSVAVSGMNISGTVIASLAASCAHDAAANGNTASSSADNVVTYNLLPLVGIGGQATGEEAAVAAHDSYRFKVWGRVTRVDANLFRVDDGSGRSVLVSAPGHGLSDSDFAAAVGILDTSQSPPVLTSTRFDVARL